MTASRIFEYARRTADKIAVTYNGVSFSYADFARFIDVARGYFMRQDLPQGSVAVIDVDNLLEAWILGMALRSLGCTTIATRVAGGIVELGIRNVGCVVTTAAEDRAGSERHTTGFPWRLIRVPADLRPGAMQGPIPDLPRMMRSGGHIMMTSGTTGVYKKVVRDAAMEALALPLHAEINGISRESVVYVANFGLWTAGGYRWPLITWSVGGTVVMHQAPDLRSPLSRHDMTHIFATPALLEALCHAAAGPLRRNDATRLLVTGGAMSQNMLATAKRLLTRQVYSVLASTEALTMAVTSLDQPEDLLWHRIHPSREVQVVDETGTVLGPGIEGLIRVRIIDGLQGYLDDGDATRTFFHGGYFYPGDLGIFGRDGRLALRGRATDVINVLGTKLATGPIERALQDGLGVAGACVLSVPSRECGEEVYVVIQSGRRVEPAEIEAAGGAELARLKGVTIHVALVEKLPRNEMGKIKRTELRRQLTSALAGSSGVARC